MLFLLNSPSGLYPMGLYPSGFFDGVCVQKLVFNFGPRWRLLGLWPKIFLLVTYHPRSHYVILHYENYIICIFWIEDFFLLKGWDLVAEILRCLGFPYPNISGFLYKGFTSYLLNTPTRNTIWVFSFFFLVLWERVWEL